jgi:hypothetical protein
MTLPSKDITKHTLHLVVFGNTIKLQGSLEEPDLNEWLVPLLMDIHQTAIAQKMPEIIFDIRYLQYANAGLWRSLLIWLRSLHDSQQRSYKIRMLSDPAHRWQKMGMPPFKTFGQESLVVR